MSDADESPFEDFGQGASVETAESSTTSMESTVIPTTAQQDSPQEHFLAALSIARQIRAGRTPELVTTWAYRMKMFQGGHK